MDRGLAQAVIRRLPNAEARILSQAYVGFVADKEVLGRGFLQVVFTSVIVIPPVLHIYPSITDVI